MNEKQKSARDSVAEVLRKPLTKKFFHPITAPQGNYQMDIAFMKYANSAKYRKANEGFTCMLLCVEIASRYAYLVPMKSKNQDDVTDAAKKIFLQAADDGHQINALTTDDGSEFTNKKFQSLLKDFEITTHWIKEPGDRYSLGIIDRLTRTLKTWIEDYQIEKGDISWVHSLPFVLKRYNEHTIRSLEMTPIAMRDMSLADTKRIGEMNRKRGLIAQSRANNIKIGDRVRILLRPGDQERDISRLSKAKDLAKGISRWSNKVYIVVATEKWSFTLENLQKQKMKRTYRAHELMKVKPTSTDVTDIFEGVAKEDRRGRRAIREHLD